MVVLKAEKRELKSRKAKKRMSSLADQLKRSHGRQTAKKVIIRVKGKK